MRLSPLFCSIAAVLAAGSATAADRVSDVDYLRASRCRGLAAGLGADTTALDTFVKVQGRSRDQFVHQRGEEEAARGKRDAKRAGRTAEATSELGGPCQAFKG